MDSKQMTKSVDKSCIRAKLVQTITIGISICRREFNTSSKFVWKFWADRRQNVWQPYFQNSCLNISWIRQFAKTDVENADLSKRQTCLDEVFHQVSSPSYKALKGTHKALKGSIRPLMALTFWAFPFKGFMILCVFDICHMFNLLFLISRNVCFCIPSSTIYNLSFVILVSTVSFLYFHDSFFEFISIFETF